MDNPNYQLKLFNEESSEILDNFSDLLSLLKIRYSTAVQIVVTDSISIDDITYISNAYPNIPIKIVGITTNSFIINQSLNNNILFDSCTIKTIEFNGQGDRRINIRDIYLNNNCQIKSFKIYHVALSSILDISDNCKINEVALNLSHIPSLSFEDVTVDTKMVIRDTSINDIKFKNLNGIVELTNIRDNKSISLVNLLNRFSIANCTLNKFSIDNLKAKKAKIELTNCDFETSSTINLINLNNTNIEIFQCLFLQTYTFQLYRGFNSQVILNQCNFNKNLKVVDSKNYKVTIKLIIKDTVFRELVTFERTQPENLVIINTLFQNGVSIPISDNYSKNIHSSVWCVLKNQAIQSNDRIKALEFRKLEMDAYTRELFSKPKKYQEKTILILNKISNNHGLSWTRGLGFTLGIVFFFYFLYHLAENNFHISFNNISFTNVKEFVINALQFLWIPEGIKDLPDKLLLSKSWYSFLTMILSFYLGKIFIAFGIYQTVAAFRKHGKI